MMCNGYRFAHPHIITLRRRLATGLARPARALGARATTLFKRNSTSCLICFFAGLLPWLRLRTVFRHPCLQTRGGDSVAAKCLSTGHLVCVRTSHDCLRCGTWFARLAHSRRSCSAFAGWDSLANHSLGLITLGFAGAMNGLSNRRLAGCLTWKERLLCPLSCRWRSYWHPCHPGLTNADVHASVLDFFRCTQTCGMNGVLQRATFANVRHMRRRWHLSLSWKPNYRRLFSAHSARMNAHPIEQLPSIKRFEPSTSQGEYPFRRKRPIVFGHCG